MTVSPDRIKPPAIPDHPTEAGVYDPTAVLWNPTVKKQPGKVIVDERVQRVFRPPFAKQVSSRFNIALADPAHISRRKDGTLSIMDGQHTCWAASDNGVTELHCIYHDGLTLEQEAVFHLEKQSERKADYARDKFDLRVQAGIPEYVATRKMLSKHGLSVGTHIRAAGAVIYVVEKFGTQALESTIITVNSWCNGKPGRDDWDQAVIRSLGYLFGHHPLVADPVQLGKKLQKKTTPQGMRGEIAAKSKGGGGSGSRTKIGAKIIADIWNVRRAAANQFPMGLLGVMETDDDDYEDDEDDE